MLKILMAKTLYSTKCSDSKKKENEFRVRISIYKLETWLMFVATTSMFYTVLLDKFDIVFNTLFNVRGIFDKANIHRFS